jgi:hypothetical protein
VTGWAADTAGELSAVLVARLGFLLGMVLTIPLRKIIPGTADMGGSG